MDHVSLLQTALELLIDGDMTEAAGALHTLAEELEEGNTLDPEEIHSVLTALVENF